MKLDIKALTKNKLSHIDELESKKSKLCRRHNCGREKFVSSPMNSI